MSLRPAWVIKGGCFNKIKEKKRERERKKKSCDTISPFSSSQVSRSRITRWTKEYVCFWACKKVQPLL
jgi:hypothetical protein